MSNPAVNRRAILYGRTSRLNERSVDSQLAAGRDWAKRNNVTVVAEFRDDGISAFNNRKARPEWRKVMAELSLGTADTLWCWEISRASRDREVWAKLVRTVQANDVLLAVGEKLHDPNDPDDGFMLDLTAALAVRESAMTRKRINRTIKDQAAAGRPHGKIPFGYRREYDPASGRLLRQVPNEATAPIVREMARRVLAGESMYSICVDFNQRGLPSPETVRQRRVRGDDVAPIPWYPGEIKDQLLTPTNAGQRSRNGVVVADATWPAIISPADHKALKDKLETPGRKAWRDGGAKHLMSGLAVCGVCGSKLRRMQNRGYPSYMCPAPLAGGGFCVSRRQEPVDLLVGDAIVAYCSRSDVRARLLEETQEDDVLEAATELADLRARLDSFVASAAGGGISAEALAAIEMRLRPQIADAEMRAAPRSLPGPVVDLLVPDPGKVWEAYDVAQRRQVVRFMMRVIVHKSASGRGARGFDPARVQVVWLMGPGA